MNPWIDLFSLRNIPAISSFSIPSSIYSPNSLLLRFNINTVIWFTSAPMMKTTMILTTTIKNGRIDGSFIMAEISSENTTILNDSIKTTVMTRVMI